MAICCANLMRLQRAYYRLRRFSLVPRRCRHGRVRRHGALAVRMLPAARQRIGVKSAAARGDRPVTWPDAAAARPRHDGRPLHPREVRRAALQASRQTVTPAVNRSPCIPHCQPQSVHIALSIAVHANCMAFHEDKALHSGRGSHCRLPDVPQVLDRDWPHVRQTESATWTSEARACCRPEQGKSNWKPPAGRGNRVTYSRCRPPSTEISH